MQAGKLRHRLTFQRPVYTQDSQTGAQTPDWQDAFTLWGRVEPLSGRDFLAAQEHETQISARITVRFNAGITSDMRILHREKYYSIEAPLPDVKSGIEYLTLLVSEGLHKE